MRAITWLLETTVLIKIEAYLFCHDWKTGATLLVSKFLFCSAYLYLFWWPSSLTVSAVSFCWLGNVAQSLTLQPHWESLKHPHERVLKVSGQHLHHLTSLAPESESTSAAASPPTHDLTSPSSPRLRGHHQEASLSPPEHCSGSPRVCQHFLTQSSLIFSFFLKLQPYSSSTLQRRLEYTSSHFPQLGSNCNCSCSLWVFVVYFLFVP